MVQRKPCNVETQLRSQRFQHQAEIGRESPRSPVAAAALGGGACH